jgi:hypothetical protein
MAVLSAFFWACAPKPRAREPETRYTVYIFDPDSTRVFTDVKAIWGVDNLVHKIVRPNDTYVYTNSQFTAIGRRVYPND